MGIFSVKRPFFGVPILLVLGATFPAAQVSGQTASGTAQIEEVTVTARKREENLQQVPESVTAFTAERIESSGITDVSDFLLLTPNVSFRDGTSFRSGQIVISMRGIGNGQQGWAPVTFLVDGVPTDSTDSINSGSLIDIERIEVLRGPQSALYGAGAIAGAINVVTKRPMNEFEFKARAGYAKGNDQRYEGMISGPIIEDKLLFRVNALYHNSDGLIDSESNGLDLDFEKQKTLNAKLLYTPTERLEFDFQLLYNSEENGSVYQDKIPSFDYIEVFNEITNARRRFPGVDDRESKKVSLRAQWDLPRVSLLSVTSYNDLDQQVLASFCWDDPDSPAIDADPNTPGVQVACALGGAQGSAAAPGEAIDQLFDQLDNFETFTQEVRVSSSDDQRARWLVGGQVIDRQALRGFDGSLIVAPDNTIVTLFPNWNQLEDFWWGVYASLSFDVNEKLEATLTARYDETESKNTAYTDRHQSAIVQVPNTDGALIDTQVKTDNAFQPKVQFSYQWTDDVMTFVSWSEGYRAGFFNTGAFTAAEDTTNFEAGVKATLFNRRVRANMSVFHIDYSDQQFSQIIDTPPFRFPVTLPETDIDGVEVEANWIVSEVLTVGGSVGYLDSRQVDGLRSPIAPKWTTNLMADLLYPIVDDWSLRVHGDYRYTDEMFLSQGEAALIGSKKFLNLRLGMENENWRVTIFGSNLTDERQTEIAPFPLAGGLIRAQNKPRTYGVEVAYQF